MIIFIAGDHVTGTGPANVTQYYIDNLPKGTLYLKSRAKAARAIEIIYKTLRADVCVYSGYSGQNVLGMRAAKLFHKKTAYLMHGCVEHENAINHEEDEKMNAVERKTLKLCDVIYAVSPSFADFIREKYPEYAGKTDHVSNGIDKALFDDAKEDRHSEGEAEERSRFMIFSVGGGMPRKKIKYICRAVQLLRDEYDDRITLTVVGDTGEDSKEIDSFDFVDDLGIVGHKEVIRLYKRSAVFVQNSCFETFGLAPLEAISCGCSCLLSDKAGALCLIGNAGEADLIRNCGDVREIADKIRQLLDEPNADRLYKSIDWENESWKRRADVLLKKLEKLVN